MTLKLDLVTVLVFSATAMAAYPDAPISPAQMQKLLGKGFDVRWAEFPGDISNYTAKHPQTVQLNNFNNVRIRVDNDLTDATFAAHLDTVIYDCLNVGLIPILAKKGTVLKNNPTSSKALSDFVAWWDIAAQRYANVTHKLLFDIMVEPAKELGSDLDVLNKVYLKTTAAIRKTNPTRILSFAPGHIASPDYLHKLVIPAAASPYAMVEWHTWASGPNADPNSKKYWSGNGTAAQRKYFTDLADKAHNYKLPTWFGAWMTNDFNHGSHFTVPQQYAFAEFICGQLKNRGIPWSLNTYSLLFNIADDTPVPELEPVLGLLKTC